MLTQTSDAAAARALKAKPQEPQVTPTNVRVKQETMVKTESSGPSQELLAAYNALQMNQTGKAGAPFSVDQLLIGAHEGPTQNVANRPGNPPVKYEGE